jgi:diguanylate cyclase (GGDEF)-like protein
MMSIKSSAILPICTQAQPRHARMNILLIDDQPSLRASMSLQLVTMGHQVQEAESAQHALVALSKHRPDVVLLDVVMPGEDGYWLARQIRNMEGCHWTPIIFLSSMDREIDLWKGIEAGGDDYLIKPVPAMVLGAKLHAMARLQRMREELIQTSEALLTANQQLQHQTRQDALTGLGNRRSFDEHLQVSLRQCHRDQVPLTLLLADVDHFKRYNDAAGHPAGDLCLQNLGNVLRMACRRPLDHAARYGGEEFGLILPNTSKSGAMTFARALQQLVSSQMGAHPNSPVSDRVTLSGGITTVMPEADTTVSSLVMRADQALYTAKAQGRNRFFSFEMQQDTSAHLSSPPASSF